MDLIERIKKKAKEDLKTLVLPEAMDERVLRAAERIVDEGFAGEVILLGEVEAISKEAQKCGVSLNRIKIVDPAEGPGGEESYKKDEFANIYYELRKKKGITPEDAAEIVKDPLYFGSLMLKAGDADALVAGSDSPTSSMLRAVLQSLDRTSESGIVSSCFIMVVPDCEYGADGILAFADSAVVPDPSPQQLADIAVSTATTFKAITGNQPEVAMLSFSTKGSAKHRLVDKVIEATKLAKESNPEIVLDGELQGDAALVPFVAEKKAPSSHVAGRANVLIFPDLNTGNVVYKLVERLAKAKAYGPLIQGLKRPTSDLSRGCSVDDIVDISAITLVRAQGV